jgi:hypothetical protein
MDRGEWVESGTPVIILEAEDRHAKIKKAKAEISSLRLEERSS